MTDDDCAPNGNVTNHTRMKKRYFNGDDARCTGRDRGVSGLLVRAGSGDQGLVHIAEPVKSRQFKERTFLGPARVLLPERIGTREGSKCQATAWIVVGDQVVRCSTAHMRPLTNAEQTLCSLRDGETTSFQEPV